MKVLSVLLVSFLVAAAGPATARLDREPGTYWRAETEGSPLATQVGEWEESADGRGVRLDFQGGHLIGAHTKVVAGWLTPFSTKGEEPRFELEYEMTNVNELGSAIRIVEMFRFRLRGEKWWPWFRDPFTLKPGTNYRGGGVTLGGNRAGQVQLEWRVKVFIEAPTYLGGYVEASIN